MIRTNTLFFAVTELERMLGECKVLDMEIDGNGTGRVKASVPDGQVLHYNKLTCPQKGSGMATALIRSSSRI